jgi:outer membrane protein
MKKSRSVVTPIILLALTLLLKSGEVCGQTQVLPTPASSASQVDVPRSASTSTIAVLPSPLFTVPVGMQLRSRGGSATLGEAITLDRALVLARANEPAFTAAAAASQVARLDKSIARAALLPSVVYHNQYLFTESNHLSQRATATTANQSTQIFLANNAVHEYASQGSVTETIGLTQLNAVSRADAALAIANAELEINRRGLNSTVVGMFYSTLTSQAKITIERRALDEAQDFVKQTQLREAKREVARADVVKAQLALQQRQREMADAELLADRSRLDLAVLLFSDPRSPYTVVPPAISSMPTREAIEAAAASFNPEFASAMASVRAASLDVSAARAAYLPDLVFNYTYGIDAARFASKGQDGSHNLGYSASVTLDIPVWNWFATAHRVKQAQILRDSAKVVLTATQGRLIASLEEFISEARVAHEQLESLLLSVDTARDSLHLTRLRYTNGEATVLEVVDAQNSLTIAELALQDGTVRYQLALANLQTLTGTL